MARSSALTFALTFAQALLELARFSGEGRRDQALEGPARLRTRCGAQRDGGGASEVAELARRTGLVPERLQLADRAYLSWHGSFPPEAIE